MLAEALQAEVDDYAPPFRKGDENGRRLGGAQRHPSGPRGIHLDGPVVVAEARPLRDARDHDSAGALSARFCPAARSA